MVVCFQMTSSNPPDAAGLETTDGQLVRQLAGLPVGAAVFGGVDDHNRLGVRVVSRTQTGWDLAGTNGGFSMTELYTPSLHGP